MDFKMWKLKVPKSVDQTDMRPGAAQQPGRILARREVLVDRVDFVRWSLTISQPLLVSYGNSLRSFKLMTKCHQYLSIIKVLDGVKILRVTIYQK